MKKHLILILSLLFISGCQNVKDLEIEDTLSIFAYEENKSNIYRVGYKYFIPEGLQTDDSLMYNEVLTNNKYNFYLYVDMISYNNKIGNLYKINNEAYYSETFEYNDKFGYLEINIKENNKYLIEIMYNYAKIEVMVEEKDINETIIYAINVLKSIDYNDEVIINMLGDDVLSFTEEEYNIFNTDKSDDSYLNFDYNYTQVEDVTYDPDLIN